MNASSSSSQLPLNERRLNKPYMYKKIFEDGRSLKGAPLTLRYLRTERDYSRIGFILRKKVGNAPLRNSIRRTLRCCFQHALPLVQEGTWVLFDVSVKAGTFRRGELKAEADRLLASLAQGDILPKVLFQKKGET